MFELTIAQGIIVTAAIILATIIIAQPFRKKVHYMKLEAPEIYLLAKSIVKEIQEERLAHLVLEGMGKLLETVTPHSAVMFPRSDMTFEQQEASACAKKRKSRAGQNRLPDVFIPSKGATRAQIKIEKKQFDRRMKTRAYRAKKRAQAGQ